MRRERALHRRGRGALSAAADFRAKQRAERAIPGHEIKGEPCPLPQVEVANTPDEDATYFLDFGA